jgi:hypothetical protein
MSTRFYKTIGLIFFVLVLFCTNVFVWVHVAAVKREKAAIGLRRGAVAKEHNSLVRENARLLPIISAYGNTVRLGEEATAMLHKYYPGVQIFAKAPGRDDVVAVSRIPIFRPSAVPGVTAPSSTGVVAEDSGASANPPPSFP